MMSCRALQKTWVELCITQRLHIGHANGQLFRSAWKLTLCAPKVFALWALWQGLRPGARGTKSPLRARKVAVPSFGYGDATQLVLSTSHVTLKLKFQLSLPPDNLVAVPCLCAKPTFATISHPPRSVRMLRAAQMGARIGQLGQPGACSLMSHRMHARAFSIRSPRLVNA